jgi:hypothetical protein
MTVIGFNFTELSVKRGEAGKGKVKVNNKVNIKSVEAQKSAVAGEGAQVTKIDFEFSIEYEPKIGSMDMAGSLAYLSKSAEAEAILKEWTEKKSLPETTTKVVMRHILDKCMIQAIIMSKDVHLPSPVPLPKLGTQSKA